MSKQQSQCPECEAPEGRTHTLACSRISKEDRLRERIATLENRVTYYREHAQRLRAAIAEWHGRYAILKLENNALRRKLYAHSRQETPFAKYSDLLRRLRALSDAGHGGSEGAERLRKRMDTVWALLTDEEIAEIRRQPRIKR